MRVLIMTVLLAWCPLALAQNYEYFYYEDVPEVIEKDARALSENGRTLLEDGRLSSESGRLSSEDGEVPLLSDSVVARLTDGVAAKAAGSSVDVKNAGSYTLVTVPFSKSIIPSWNSTQAATVSTLGNIGLLIGGLYLLSGFGGAASSLGRSDPFGLSKRFGAPQQIQRHHRFQHKLGHLPTNRIREPSHPAKRKPAKKPYPEPYPVKTAFRENKPFPAQKFHRMKEIKNRQKEVYTSHRFHNEKENLPTRNFNREKETKPENKFIRKKETNPSRKIKRERVPLTKQRVNPDKEEFRSKKNVRKEQQSQAQDGRQGPREEDKGPREEGQGPRRPRPALNLRMPNLATRPINLNNIRENLAKMPKLPKMPELTNLRNQMEEGGANLRNALKNQMKEGEANIRDAVRNIPGLPEVLPNVMSTLPKLPALPNMPKLPTIRNPFQRRPSNRPAPRVQASPAPAEQDTRTNTIPQPSSFRVEETELKEPLTSSFSNSLLDDPFQEFDDSDFISSSSFKEILAEQWGDFSFDKVKPSSS